MGIKDQSLSVEVPANGGDPTLRKGSQGRSVAGNNHVWAIEGRTAKEGEERSLVARGWDGRCWQLAGLVLADPWLRDEGLATMTSRRWELAKK